jgi:hypothetical protein
VTLAYLTSRASTASSTARMKVTWDGGDRFMRDFPLLASGSVATFRNKHDYNFQFAATHRKRMIVSQPPLIGSPRA